jgi:hypothetical protein
MARPRNVNVLGYCIRRRKVREVTASAADDAKVMRRNDLRGTGGGVAPVMACARRNESRNPLRKQIPFRI